MNIIKLESIYLIAVLTMFGGCHSLSLDHRTGLFPPVACIETPGGILDELYKALCNIDCKCVHGSPIGGQCNFMKHTCVCQYPLGFHADNVTGDSCDGVPSLHPTEIAKSLSGLPNPLTQPHHYFRFPSSEHWMKR